MAYESTAPRERRRFQRSRHLASAWLRFDGDPVVYCTLARDLSAKGAQFRMTKTVPIYTRVMVSLQLNGYSLPMECKGNVSWADITPDGLQAFGVDFVDLASHECDRIARHLNGLLPEPPMLAAAH